MPGWVVGYFICVDAQGPDADQRQCSSKTASLALRSCCVYIDKCVVSLVRSASLRASLRRKERSWLVLYLALTKQLARKLSRRGGATFVRPLPGTGSSVFPHRRIA